MCVAEQNSNAYTHCLLADIDECVTGAHNCSSPARCVNEDGFFRCTCPEGYHLDDSQASCIGLPDAWSLWSSFDFEPYTDVDECIEGTAGCSQKCNNTVGSYICSCMEGYELTFDGRTCIGM